MSSNDRSWNLYNNPDAAGIVFRLAGPNAVRQHSHQLVDIRFMDQTSYLATWKIILWVDPVVVQLRPWLYQKQAGTFAKCQRVARIVRIWKIHPGSLCKCFQISRLIRCRQTSKVLCVVSAPHSWGNLEVIVHVVTKCVVLRKEDTQRKSLNICYGLVAC